MATPPRPVLPGKTYHVVSRCVGRTFRLVPLRAVNAVLWYCLAAALSLTGVEIHEFCFMSNHYHLVVTDTRGELPSFMNRLNSLVSRSLNALRGWSGTNFEKDYSRIEELDTAQALKTCAYILANPPRADLVVKGKDWRGLTSVNMKYGDKLLVPRPLLGLWKHLKNPEKKKRKRKNVVAKGREKRMGRCKLAAMFEVELKPLPLPFGGSPDEMRQTILEQLEVYEAEAEAKRVNEGRKVLGMRRVLAQDWNDRPRKREDLFGPEPKAAGCRWKKLEHAVRDAVFVKEHHDARKLALAGERPTFPAGTWAMVRRFGYACASP